MSRMTLEKAQIERMITNQKKDHRINIRLSDYEYRLINETLKKINNTKNEYAKNITITDLIRESLLAKCKEKIKN